ncbi:MAG: hypothetical protein ACRECN_00650 [Methylocella sp.]
MRSRLFARSIGALAKTDTADARMLAIIGESLSPAARAPPPELIESLQELVRGRDTAIAARTAILNQIGASKTDLLVTELKRQLRAIETMIANLEAGIKRRINADSALARRFTILTSILSNRSSYGGRVDRRIARDRRFVGQASRHDRRPRPDRLRERRERWCPSHSGRTHSSSQPAFPWPPSARPNAILTSKYSTNDLSPPANSPPVALTAVMRKLIIPANTLVREDRLWQPNPA